MKLYDQAEECELKVNDVVEIFGVFELDLEPEGVVPPGADNMQAMVAEERALRPPPSAQPRLHCILHRKLPAQHHPLLPPPDTREEQLVMASARAQLGAVRPVVLAAFTSALGGDALAAEYAAYLPATAPTAPSSLLRLRCLLLPLHHLALLLDYSSGAPPLRLPVFD